MKSDVSSVSPEFLRERIEEARRNAEPGGANDGPQLNSQQPPFAERLEQEQGGNACGGTKVAYPPVDWRAARAGLKGGKKKFIHQAIYPKDSILTPYMKYVREVSEGVDCYIIGSVLPVVAAAVARRVWFEWDNGHLYPNIFSTLVGRPGDRKSSTIKSAAKLAWCLFPANAFLPTNISTEALFDEYYEPAGGRPDKIWICDDANVVLANWKNSSHGERVSAQFLRLFDCMELTESFERNRKKEGKEARRAVSVTSTSIVFGATFNAAAFQGAQIKQGMARRFLHYAGDGHGRTIILPKQTDFREIVDPFKPLLAFRGAMKLSDEAYRRWENYQNDNRRQMEELDPSQEVLGNRLNTCPTWVLKIAMLFEACTAVHYGDTETHLISDNSLELAIEHVEENLRSAEFVDKIIEQKAITQQAEIILAIIRQEFQAEGNGTIYLTRSQLTRRFCSHGRGRQNLEVDDLYLKFIPSLEAIGVAKLVHERGKLQIYAFAPEEKFQNEDTETEN